MDAEPSFEDVELNAIGDMIRRLRDNLTISKTNGKRVGAILSASEAHCAWRLVFENSATTQGEAASALCVKLREPEHPNSPNVVLGHRAAVLLYDLLFVAKGADERADLIGARSDG